MNQRLASGVLAQPVSSRYQTSRGRLCAAALLTLALVSVPALATGESAAGGSEEGTAGEESVPVRGGGSKETLTVGMQAPAFLARTINGEQANVARLVLAQLVGPKADEAKKAVVLSFGASYCKPCRRELPELQKLADRFSGQNVQFAAVVIDSDKEGQAAMKKLVVDELALSIPVLSDRFQILARRYGVKELPHLVVIDGQGKVAAVQSGFREGAMEQLEQRVTAVVGGEAPSAAKGSVANAGSSDESAGEAQGESAHGAGAGEDAPGGATAAESRSELRPEDRLDPDVEVVESAE